MTDDQQLIAEARKGAAQENAYSRLLVALADALSTAATRYRAEGWDEGYEAAKRDFLPATRAFSWQNESRAEGSDR